MDEKLIKAAEEYATILTTKEGKKIINESNKNAFIAGVEWKQRQDKTVLEDNASITFANVVLIAMMALWCFLIWDFVLTI